MGRHWRGFSPLTNQCSGQGAVHGARKAASHCSRGVQAHAVQGPGAAAAEQTRTIAATCKGLLQLPRRAAARKRAAGGGLIVFFAFGLKPQPKIKHQPTGLWERPGRAGSVVGVLQLAACQVWLMQPPLAAAA